MIKLHFACLIVGSLTQAIRNFAKSLETWLKSAMTDVPEEMVKTKVQRTTNLICLKETTVKTFISKKFLK